jgi:uncharacterized spore protein YtfJ
VAFVNIMELVERSKDNVTVQRVFGEPIQHGDVTVIPVAKIAHGGGGGMGSRGPSLSPSEEAESGGGGGFGYTASPAGVFVIKNGEVRWQPAVDVNRIVIGGQLVGIVLLLVVRAVLRRAFKKRR